MTDPLANVVTLLQVGAQLSKVVSGAGAWTVRRVEAGQPFYCAVLDGACRLAVDGQEPMTLAAEDFVLIPAARGFTMSSLDPTPSEGADPADVAVLADETRHGRREGAPDVRLLVGYCTLGSADASLAGVNYLVHSCCLTEDCYRPLLSAGTGFCLSLDL